MKDHPFFELFHPYILHQYQDANKRVGFSAFGVGPSQLATTSFSHGIDESPPSRYLESSGRPSDTDINEYSEVEVTGRQGELVSSLQKLEPRLERLSLIVIAGEPEIHGDLGQQRLVPIAYIGEGFRRLLSILLAIANCQGGAVLIDEIENGIHHSILEDVWSAIAEMARKADVQVFATTHSYECITAAHRAFQSDGTYDLRLHRLERENDQVRSVTYDQESLETSVAFHWEVR